MTANLHLLVRFGFLLRGASLLTFQMPVAAADTRPSASGRTQEEPGMLPEYLVVENVSQRPVLYGEIPGFQIWSMASEADTQKAVRELQRQKLLRDLIIPDDLRYRYSAPIIYVINDASANPVFTQRGQQPVGEAIKESQRQASGAFRSADPTLLDPSTVDIMQHKIPLPNPDLEKWERSPGIVIQSVTEFGVGSLHTSVRTFTSDTQISNNDADEMGFYTSSWKHLWPTVSTRDGWLLPVPTARGSVSLWLNPGVLRFLYSGTFTEDSVVLRDSLVEVSPQEYPSLSAFFTPTLSPSSAVQALRNNFGLWALLENPARAGAFWKFVRRSQTQPVTDELLKEIFGMDYTGLLAELRRFVESRKPGVLKKSRLILTREFTVPKMTKFPDVALHRATRAELVRGKSEWERLTAIQPKWRGAGSASAQQRLLRSAESRLERAYSDGERDPQLVGVLALVECDLGDAAKARRYLEEAAAANVVRPRVHYELARARYLEARAKPEGNAVGSLSDEQADRAFAPLIAARRLSPPLPEIYLLTADILMRSARKPSREHLAILEEGLRLYPFQSNLGHRTALLFARAGLKAEAATILDAAANNAPERHSPLTGPSQSLVLKAALRDDTQLPEVVRQQARTGLLPGRDLTDSYDRLKKIARNQGSVGQ